MMRTHSPKWLVTALTIAVIVLAVAGIALLVTYFLLGRSPAAQNSWRDPQTAVQAAAIAPDLAVLTLAGEPDERVIRAALDARELETAYATLANSLLLSDKLRSGNWLLLAGQLAEKDPARARIAYQSALDLAALGPTLNDMARADLSLQTAAGFDGQNAPAVGRLAIAQAADVARHSVTLLPAQRRTLLMQVSEAYRKRGEAAASQEVAARLAADAAGPGVTVPAAEPLLPTLRGGVVLPDAVASALVARQTAAADLAARWLTSASGTRSSLSQALGQALLAEDAARDAFYATADQLALPDRLALWHDKLAWLAVKSRVAQRGYGLSLVPDWEAQTADIEAALAGAFTDLVNGYGQQLDTLDATEALQARVELLRQGVLWIRLGFFGDAAAEQTLSDQLTEASRQLWLRQGNAGLMVFSQTVDGQRFYLLSGAEPATKTP